MYRCVIQCYAACYCGYVNVHVHMLGSVSGHDVILMPNSLNASATYPATGPYSEKICWQKSRTSPCMRYNNMVETITQAY